MPLTYTCRCQACLKINPQGCEMNSRKLRDHQIAGLGPKARPNPITPISPDPPPTYSAESFNPSKKFLQFLQEIQDTLEDRYYSPSLKFTTLEFLPLSAHDMTPKLNPTSKSNQQVLQHQSGLKKIIEQAQSKSPSMDPTVLL